MAGDDGVCGEDYSTPSRQHANISELKPPVLARVFHPAVVNTGIDAQVPCV